MWHFEKCERHWAKRRSGYLRRSIADHGWNHHREYMEWNGVENCFDLTLHTTVIVRVFPTKFRLNCGGWWTQLTKKKISEWAGADLNSGPWRLRQRKVLVEVKFIRVGSGYYPFYNGLEITSDGEVINPQPCHVKKVKPGAAKEFTRVRRAVWERIATRVLIGEFDQREDELHTCGSVPTSEELWECMTEIAAFDIGGIIPHELVSPLLTQRPKKYFGKPAHSRSWNRPAPEELRTGAQLLESSFVVARQYFHYINDSFIEVEVPIGE